MYNFIVRTCPHSVMPVLSLVCSICCSVSHLLVCLPSVHSVKSVLSLVCLFSVPVIMSLVCPICPARTDSFLFYLSHLLQLSCLLSVLSVLFPICPPAVLSVPCPISPSAVLSVLCRNLVMSIPLCTEYSTD